MTQPLSVPASPDEDLAFVEAARTRRALVYDYLDAWPGAAGFQPADIHEAIYSYIRRRGKALRPIVLLLSCGAVGGDESQGIPAAAAVEVFHTWTLVHDDIIDRDDTRRGQPTVHAMYRSRGAQDYGLAGDDADHYGRAVAILAGDLQQSWAFGLLAELVRRGVDPALVVRLVDRMAGWLTPELLEGEMLDVQYALTPVDGLTEGDVLKMLAKKTGALLEYSAWAGARIGLGTREDERGWADKLGRFAALSGIAFQLQDDVLGLTADAELLGKPIGSDLREGKHTLILHRALAIAGASERSAILAALRNHDASPQQVGEALGAIRATGALDEVARMAQWQISQAQELLAELPASPERDLLGRWAQFLLSRKN